MLPTLGTGPKELENIVKHVLGPELCPLETTLVFWTQGRRINGSLREQLELLQLSQESTLLVEYDVRPPSPEPDLAISEPDWIRSVGIGLEGIVTGSFDRSVRLYLPPFSHAPIQGKPTPDSVTTVCWLDRNRVATGSADGSIRIWSRQMDVEQVLKGHSSAVQNLIVSPDGKYVYSADYDGIVCQFHNDPEASTVPVVPRSQRPSRKAPPATFYREQLAIKSWRGNESTISSLLFNHDGTLMCIGWDGRVALFSHPDCLPRGRFSLSKDVCSVCIMNMDGSGYLVTGHADGSLRIYNLNCPGDDCHAVRRSAHDGWISGIAAAMTGRFVSCGHDGAVRVWELQDLSQPVASIREPSASKMLAVDWRDDVLAVVGQEKTLFTFRT